MGDLTICADVLQAYLDEKGYVPWDDLRYIFGEIMYGGHITGNELARVSGDESVIAGAQTFGIDARTTRTWK